MDLHHTASHAPVREAEPLPAGAVYPSPDADVRMAERQREDAALDALEAEITQLWGHINAATAYFLTLVAEFDRREGWAQHGLASCAQWLNWQCGIGAVAAREKVHGECFCGNTCAESGKTSAATGAEQLKVFNTARGLAIDAGTARCRWRGERMDYDIAIDALCREAGYG